MNLMEKVKKTDIEKNSLGIFWLGQAGFLIKTPLGRTIAIDPYLSNLCNRIAGFKRIFPPIIASEELDVDYLFISHEHPDHFDTDMIKKLDKKNMKIFGTIECKKIADKMFADSESFILLEKNKKVYFEEFSLLPVVADHGELSPNALGFILDFKFVKVYFAGDTAYSPDKLLIPIKTKPEIALIPINGQYGNLNSSEAVLLSRDINAKIVIPCHFWTFIEHGSNPLEFKEKMEKDYPECNLVFMSFGEGFIYNSD